MFPFTSVKECWVNKVLGFSMSSRLVHPWIQQRGVHICNFLPLIFEDVQTGFAYVSLQNCDSNGFNATALLVSSFKEKHSCTCIGG